MYIDLPLVTHVSLDWTDRKRKTVKLIGGKFVASVISICHIFIDCIFLFVLSAINLITYARLENDRLNKFGVNRYCVKCDIISLCLDAYCRDDLSIYEICEYMHDMIRLRYQTRRFWTLNNTDALRNTRANGIPNIELLSKNVRVRFAINQKLCISIRVESSKHFSFLLLLNNNAIILTKQYTNIFGSFALLALYVFYGTIYRVYYIDDTHKFRLSTIYIFITFSL